MSKIKPIIFIIFLSLCFQISAQKKYALLVGIDEYIPKGKNAVKNFRLGNLDGCVNDVSAINELLMTKFGFKNNEIKILLNSNASRDSIIAQFKNLANIAKKGDNVFIFYAGHGSQVKNSLSSEADKKDETIVPADAYLGIPDIRDKEIAVLLDNIVSKGIILTAIFDCCHSGSMARGLFDSKPDKLRWCAPDMEHDAKDGSESPRPEEKGALIISAAQDDEPASEFRMENNTPHGAFTFAFIQTMNNLPANASSEQIFLSIRSILKYYNKKQEPVIAGNNHRLQNNILGLPNSTIPKQALIAVINPQSDQEIIIQAGYVTGIDVGYRLAHKTEKDSVVLEITEVQSANTSIAKIVQGNIKSIKAGDMFEIVSIKTKTNSVLKIFIPETMNYDILFNQISKFQIALEQNPTLEIIQNPKLTSPTHTLFYAHKKWVLFDSYGKEEIIGETLLADKVLQLVNGKAKLYISLPVFTELNDFISNKYQDNQKIIFTKSIAESDYVFNGRWKNNRIEYGFISPILQENDTINDLIYPFSTDYYPFSKEENENTNSYKNLEEIITKLSRIKKWLTLEPPTDDGAFPFYLTLRNRIDSTIVTDHTLLGQKYELLLKIDENNMDNYDGVARYVHIFVIDANGQMQPIYPLSNVENKYPRYDELGNLVKEYRIISNIVIGEPLGYDTFFMLVSDEPIPNFKMSVTQTGVQTRGANGGLSDLFNEQGNTRGVSYSNSSWYLRKLTVKSQKN